MLKVNFKHAATPILAILITLGGVSTANAYTCEVVFNEAQELIKKAESLVTAKTDSRITGMIAEAKGIASAGIISHRQAKEKHHGPIGKYAHGDAVRKGRWAKTMAKEALFLLTGKPL